LKAADTETSIRKRKSNLLWFRRTLAATSFLTKRPQMASGCQLPPTCPGSRVPLTLALEAAD
jgi:hypothetical protein